MPNIRAMYLDIMPTLAVWHYGEGGDLGLWSMWADSLYFWSILAVLTHSDYNNKKKQEQTSISFHSIVLFKALFVKKHIFLSSEKNWLFGIWSGILINKLFKLSY